jgi:hypothetical protein
MLHNDFAPFKTVHYHFQRWIESGRIERLHARLRRAARARGRAQAQPFRSGDPGLAERADGSPRRRGPRLLGRRQKREGAKASCRNRYDGTSLGRIRLRSRSSR